MRFYQALCIAVAFLVLTFPAAGAASSLPFLSLSDSNITDPAKLADGKNRFGYLYVTSVEYTMKNADAEIVIRYSVEPWISFLVFLFGKEDLKKRILGILQYPETGYENTQDVTFSYVDNHYAVLQVRNAALDNQDNSYWIRPHSFGCTIPTLLFIISDTDIKSFTNVKDMEKGIGFFRS